MEATTKNELVITRVFNAPREVVWRAWTTANELMKWWSPKGFTNPHASVDLRVGGKYVLCMRSPEGKDIWVTGQYRKIDAPSRLVYTDSFADADGNVVSAEYYGMDGTLPLETVVTVSLEERDGKTYMTVHHAGMQEHAGAREGWNSFFDKLAVAVEQ